MAQDAKGVRLVDVDMPEGLKPGDTATARIDVENNTLLPSPWDEDRCVGEHAGMKVEGVVVGPNGEEWVGDTECVLSAAPLGGKDRKTSEVTFEAPNTDGSHRYEAYARLTESHKETGRRSKRIDVFADEADAPEEAPDDSESGPPDWLGDWAGDGDDGSDSGMDLPFGDAGVVEQLDTLVLLAIVVVVLFAAGQLFDVQLGGGAGA